MGYTRPTAFWSPLAQGLIAMDKGLLAFQFRNRNSILLACSPQKRRFLEAEIALGLKSGHLRLHKQDHSTSIHVYTLKGARPMLQGKTPRTKKVKTKKKITAKASAPTVTKATKKTKKVKIPKAIKPPKSPIDLEMKTLEAKIKRPIHRLSYSVDQSTPFDKMMNYMHNL